MRHDPIILLLCRQIYYRTNATWTGQNGVKTWKIWISKVYWFILILEINFRFYFTYLKLWFSGSVFYISQRANLQNTRPGLYTSQRYMDGGSIKEEHMASYARSPAEGVFLNLGRAIWDGGHVLHRNCIESVCMPSRWITIQGCRLDQYLFEPVCSRDRGVKILRLWL